MKILSIAVNLALMVATLTAATFAVDLTPEEVVAKHLDSIGKKEKRNAPRTLMAVGLSEFEARVPVITGGGKAIVVSNPDNLFWVISLNSKEYPFEKIGFFGDKVSLPFITSGTRSLIGTFLADHSKILGDGLFGGAMSLRWNLLDVEKYKTQLRGGGTRKIDGRKLITLDYNSLSGGGAASFTVKLYFDPETFNHVRTEYRYEVAALEGTFGRANQQAASVVSLIEQFADFKETDGLNLPYSYRVTYRTNSNVGMFENSLGIKVSQYVLNQTLAADFFTFDAK